MSRKLVLVFSLLLTVMFASANAVAAQNGTPASSVSVDFDAANDAVLAADPEALVTGLQERPGDDLLPEGFMNPSNGTPENEELITAFEGGLGTVDNAVGQVTHGFDTDTDVIPGEVSAGILTYIVTDDEITSDMLDDYQSGMEEGAADQQEGMTADVQRIDIDGTEAVLMTLTLEDSSSNAVVQMISIPVGNTMVVATIVSASTSDVDPSEVEGPTQDLALAGVNYLQQVAEANAS